MSDTQEKKQFVEDLTDQSDDFSRWYLEVVRKAQGDVHSPSANAPCAPPTRCRLRSFEAA